jgi:hypothetical protein
MEMPMYQEHADMPLAEYRKKEIFQALVSSQDEGLSVPQSRTSTAERYQVTESTIKSIEREGIENNWPPL